MKYIYARVSTEEQDTENQLAELKKKAPNAKVYTDVISGAKSKPNLIELLDVLKKGDSLYIYKFDRLSRDAVESLVIQRQLDKMGVKVIAISQNIAADSAGALLKTVLAGVAQFERDLISERTKLGLKKARANGKKLGGHRKGSGAKNAHKYTEDQFDFIEYQLRKDGGSQPKMTVAFNEKYGTSLSRTQLMRKYRKHRHPLLKEKPQPVV